MTTITFTDSDADFTSTRINKVIGAYTVSFSGGYGNDNQGLGIDTYDNNQGVYAYQGPEDQIKLIVTVTPGYTFDINSFGVGVDSGQLAVSFVYGNGSTGNFTQTLTAGAWQTLSSFSTPLDDVKQVVLSSDKFGIFQNFGISDIKAIVATPTVTDGNISIASTGTGTSGTYRIGDTVTARWDDTATGDNNAGVTGATMDFSQFGGGSGVTATSDGAGHWTASYTITSGSIDATGRNVSVSATNSGGTTTTADSTNLSVDNAPPTVTDARISIGGASGTGGAYKIGDTVTATWNNTPGGDNNSDILSRVTVDFGQFGGGAAVAATNSGGIWSATYTITSGSIDAIGRNIAVTAVDNAGNVTTTADSANATVDNVAPVITFSGIGLSNDTGFDSTDLITRSPSQAIFATLSGTVSADEVVYGSLDNGATYSDITRYISGTSLHWDGVTLSGSGIIQLKGVDGAGNDGVIASRAYVLDTTAPAAPSAPHISAASDTGASSSDAITRNATPTFSGVAENGSVVAVYDGGSLIGTTTASGGNWSFATPVGAALSDGIHAISATATDAAGNISSASSSLVVTIDTAPPTGVTLDRASGPTQSASSGTTIATLSAHDNTAPSSALSYVLVGGDGFNDADNGRFAIAGSQLQVGNTALAAGNYHLYVAAVDPAGNAVNQALTFTVVDAPTVTSIVRTGGAGPGVSTSATSTDYTVTFDQPITGLDVTDFTLTTTGSAAGRVASVVGSGTTYVVTADNLAGDGTLRLDLNSTGTNIQNGSGGAIPGGYTSGASYTLDHTAPSAPSVPVITTASDSGTINDGVTAVKTPTVTGTSEAHAHITLYDTDGATVLGSATADGLGQWSITSVMLSEGAHVLSTKAVDAVGNVSAASGGLALTIDATLPSVASIRPSTAGPTHTTSLTYTVAFSEAVTGVTASAFTLHDASGHAVVGPVIATPVSTDGGQTYTVTVSGLTGEGMVRLDLDATGAGITDLAGNAIMGGATGVSVILDHVAPTITLAVSAGSGAASHALPTDGATGALVINAVDLAAGLNFTGAANDAHLVEVDGGAVGFLDANMHATAVLRFDLHDRGAGTAPFDVHADTSAAGGLSGLVDGTYTLLAGARDAAGNKVVTAGQTVIVDTTADIGGDAAIGIAGTTDHLINAAEAHAVGFAVSGLDADASAVATFTDGTHTLTANVAANGTGTVDLSGFNGTVTSSLTITDVHQNVASVLGSSVLVDTIAPLAPTSLADLAIRSGFVNAAANTAAQALTGTAEVGSTVTVYDGAAVLGTAEADATTGRWAYTLGALAEGAHTLSAVATDLAGNIGTVSGTLAFTVDTRAPAAPALALAHDTGVSVTDGLTRDGTLALVPSESGGTLTYMVDGAIVAAYDPASLTQGVHTVAVTQTDAAGNVSTAASLRFTLDTLAPTAPTLQLAYDTGVSAVDALTHDGSLLVSPSEAGGTLSYVVDGAAAAAYNPSLLAQGAHTIAVMHTDVAGNISVASSLGFTLDSIAPSAQADTLSARGLSAPLTGNLLANDTDASPLHLDSLQFGNGPAISVPTSGTAQIAGAHGTLTIASDGSYSYQATSAGHDVFTETVMDAAGNASQTALTLNVDHTQEATFRFFDTKTGGHFFTASADEAAQVRASMPSFTQEGIAWTTPDKGTDTVDVFRFYDTKTGDHFFTADVSERDGLIQGGTSYHYEGIAFEAFANEGSSGTAAVERFFNVQTGQHHYALAEEANGIRHGSAGGGWVDEGKAFVVQVAPHDLIA